MTDDWQALSLALLGGFAERPMWQGLLREMAMRFGAAHIAIAFDPPPGGGAGMEIAHGTPGPGGQMLDQPLSGATLRLWRAGPAFPGEVAERLRAVVPLLNQGVALLLHQAQLLREQRILATVAEAGELAVLALDPRGQLLYANPLGRRLLDQQDALALHHGRIACLDPRTTARLLELVRHFAGEQQAATTRGLFAPLALPRSSGEAPLTLLVRPGPAFEPVNAPLQRSAILIVRDPARRPSLSAETLAHLFDLTPAEAALASELAKGLTLDDAAAALDISRNTARSQLQAVFRKTGVSRQSELVLLLLGSVATLSG